GRFATCAPTVQAQVQRQPSHLSSCSRRGRNLPVSRSTSVKRRGFAMGSIAAKRFIVSLLLGTAVVALSSPPAHAAPPNVTGMWQVQQTGLNGTTNSTISLTQSGTGIVGTNAKNGNGFTGEFVDDGKING